MEAPATEPAPEWCCEHEIEPPIDVAIQCPSQSHAYRVLLYFRDRSTLIPERFHPDRVTEVGPRKDHSGPSLIVLHHVHSTASKFLSWLKATSWLSRTCARVFWLPAELPSATHAEDLEAVIAAIVRRGVVPHALRLQVCPRKSEMAVADALELAGFKLQPKLGRFQAVLGVVKVGPTAWRFGYSPARCMWRVAPDVAKQFGNLSSSACHKLDEALQTCGFRHGSLDGAIDLGAAPGAWSELLARRAKHVVAVDPADLSEQCNALPNVRHVRASSKQADQVAAAMQGHRVDVICCDMNQLPQFCSDCIGPLLPMLAPGGWVVLTCKLYGMARDRSKTEILVRALPEWEGLEPAAGLFVWLLANTANERMWILQKPRSTPPASLIKGAASPAADPERD